MDSNETGTDFNRPGNGGAVHVGGGEITVNGGSFTNNIAAREGGGLWTTTATITGATITGNVGQGPESNRGGGGLFNQAGTMTVMDSTIDNNSATGLNGSGGGILNNGGTLTLIGGTANGNTANRAGGALEDNARDNATVVSITNVTMNNNMATGGANGQLTTDAASPAADDDMAPGNGGAIHISGMGAVMDIASSMFSNNFAAKEGGALWNFAGSTMTVEGSTVDSNQSSGNAANTGGGGLFNSGGTMIVRALAATDTAPAVRSVISNNVANGASGSGGGILNVGGTLTVEDTDITGNTANRAGGAIEDNAQTAATTSTFTRVTMDGNSVGDAPGNGGAQHITGPGTVTIDQSTISNNSAANEGGGLWNHNSSTLRVWNSTISGNTSPLGAGVFTQQGAAAITTIINSTIAANNGAGIGIRPADDATETTATTATVTLSNTIVADNTADLEVDVNADFSLVETVGDATVTGGDNIIGEDPQLGPLADNGGPTLTHMVSAGPAIGGGDNAVCASGAINNVDQRDEPRPAPGSDACNIGATEFALMAQPIVAGAVTNPPEDRNVAAGDQDVPAVSFTLTPDDQGVTLTSIQGTITGGADLDLISDGDLLINGVPVTAAVFNPPTATGNFSISLPMGSVAEIGENDTAELTVTLDFGNPVMTAAGVGLFVLPLLGLLWFRRTRIALGMLLAGGLTLSACSDSEQASNSYVVTINTIAATGSVTGPEGNILAAPIVGARLSAVE